MINTHCSRANAYNNVRSVHMQRTQLTPADHVVQSVWLVEHMTHVSNATTKQCYLMASVLIVAPQVLIELISIHMISELPLTYANHVKNPVKIATAPVYSTASLAYLHSTYTQQYVYLPVQMDLTQPPCNCLHFLQ